MCVCVWRENIIYIRSLWSCTSVRRQLPESLLTLTRSEEPHLLSTGASAVAQMEDTSLILPTTLNITTVPMLKGYPSDSITSLTSITGLH